MKKMVFLIGLTLTLFGWDKFYPSFHAKVVNVAKDDVLNIRSRPNYKSKKVGFLAPNEDVQIEYCLDSPKSTWCKVYPAVSINLGGGFGEPASGFVNARFLKFKNSGYVNIKNRKSDCDYLVECKGSKCLILTYKGLEWVKRSLIGTEKGQKATSLPEEEGGEMSDDATFCFNHARDKELWAKVDEYYKKSKHQSSVKSSKTVAKEIINALKGCNIAKFKNYIHPQKGILLSYYPDFYRVKKHLSRAEFNKLYSSSKRLYWGVSEGRGDKIYLSLKSYCNTISKAAKISHKFTKATASSKGFANAKGTVAYDITQNKANPGWKGVFLVLQKYKNKWYLVGLAYSRWSI